jgi:short chain dehydrogenase
MSLLRGLIGDTHTGFLDLKGAQAIAGTLFLVVGLVKCATLASRLVLFVWRQFLRPAQSLQKYGKWAVVTGATDGIGREYCNALAKQGASVPRMRRIRVVCTASYFLLSIEDKHRVEDRWPITHAWVSLQTVLPPGFYSHFPRSVTTQCSSCLVQSQCNAQEVGVEDLA